MWCIISNGSVSYLRTRAAKISMRIRATIAVPCSDGVDAQRCSGTSMFAYCSGIMFLCCCFFVVFCFVLFFLAGGEGGLGVVRQIEFRISRIIGRKLVPNGL